ncbi:unnamed protein product [Arabidopsis halleri]
MLASSQATAELVSLVAIEIYIWFSNRCFCLWVRLVIWVSAVREAFCRGSQRGAVLASGFESEELQIHGGRVEIRISLRVLSFKSDSGASRVLTPTMRGFDRRPYVRVIFGFRWISIWLLFVIRVVLVDFGLISISSDFNNLSFDLEVLGTRCNWLSLWEEEKDLIVFEIGIRLLRLCVVSVKGLDPQPKVDSSRSGFDLGTFHGDLQWRLVHQRCVGTYRKVSDLVYTVVLGFIWGLYEMVSKSLRWVCLREKLQSLWLIQFLNSFRVYIMKWIFSIKVVSDSKTMIIWKMDIFHKGSE